MSNNQPQKKEKGQNDELDMRLLSEAVAEINVSRKSVGLYPPGHAFITNSINEAYGLLQELLAIRNTITLGIAKDSLMVDGHVLDKNIPAFRECALSYHVKGIASITFRAGLTKEELIAFHELMTLENAPSGKAFVELAEKKGISHIKLGPIDFSSFKFLEGALREGGGSGIGETALWTEYVKNLLEGRLPAGESEMLLTIPPAEVAEIINEAEPGILNDESYNRVVNQYIRGRGELRLNPETIKKLFMLIKNLDEGLREQFLSKVFENVSKDENEVEKTLNALTPDSFDSTVKFFNDFSAMVPNTLRQVIEKLAITKISKGFDFDMNSADDAVIHDIAIGNELKSLFDENSFSGFASDEYKDNLWEMLKEAAPKDETVLGKLVLDFKEEVIDRFASQSLVEVLESDLIGRSDYLAVTTKLLEFSRIFVDTGRFRDFLHIYIAIYSHYLSGRFSVETSSTIEYVFQSEESISRLIESAKVYGRTNREDFTKLAKALGNRIIPQLLNALSEEQNASVRKFFLIVLADLGPEVMPEALLRLKDKRWYVARNMLYLIGRCGRMEHAAQVRKFVKHPDVRVTAEAVGALLRLRTADAVPHLMVLLRSDNIELRNQGLKLASAYRPKDIVPLLSEMLLQKDILGAGTYDKVSIVATLARIGDERALEAFEKVMRSKVLLYKDGLTNLKLEILKNLGNFLPAKAMPILEIARGLKNEEITSMSEELINRLTNKSNMTRRRT